MPPTFISLILSCFLLIGAQISAQDEVVVKSRLSKSGERVIVHVNLPQEANVHFTLLTKEESPKHHWTDQALVSGDHMLSLPLPEIEKGIYLLLINVGEEEFRQLLVL